MAGNRSAGSIPLLIIVVALICPALPRDALPREAQSRQSGAADASAAGSVLAGRLARHLRTCEAQERLPVLVTFEETSPASRVSPPSRPYLRELRERAHAMESTVRGALAPRVAAGEVRRVRSIWIAGAVALEATPEAIRELAALPQVRRIVWDKPARVLIDPPHAPPAPPGWAPPPAPADTGWGVLKINARAAWQKGRRGQGVLVAVLDTGIDYTHTDLFERIWVNPGEVPGNLIDDDGNGYIDDVHGYNFADTLSDPMDDYGHGTRVAGIICGDGTADTLTGVAPEATVMAVKVLDSEGHAQQADVWEGMQYAVDNGARVMNLSIGWMQSDDPDRAMWRTACNNALAAGVVMIVAAGNERDDGIPAPDNIRTPGDVPGPMAAPFPSAVVTIGGTDSVDVLAYYSSFGPVEWADIPPWFDHPYPPGLTKPDVVAPGLFINTTKMGGGYTGPNQHGTSMAAPHVAGAAALLLSARPWLTPFEVDSLLEATALPRGPAGKDNYYGSGRVRVDSLMGAVASAVAGDSPPAAGLEVWPNYPNPFNPATTILFEVPRETRVRIDVFDVAGRRVRSITDRVFGPGVHTAVWDGTDDAGAPLASGVYIYRVSTGGSSKSGTMVLLK
jgi:subtilisin family serine protease